MMLPDEVEYWEFTRSILLNSARGGTRTAWPDILLTTVNMMLASRHPMFLWWGPHLIQFYNDGYRPSIRAYKHPSALGQHCAELTGRLLRAQDDERRRMARELHDNAGQTLAALSMNLSAMQRHNHLDARINTLAAESRELADDLSREIRTMSYLLHPPLLDEAGRASALQWYVDGFSQRSQIAVELDLPQDLGRLPRELELVVFRVVQEGLTNIHRHSGSPSASIRLTRSGN
jgi:signal transduction histidine kinase